MAKNPGFRSPAHQGFVMARTMGERCPQPYPRYSNAGQEYMRGANACWNNTARINKQGELVSHA